MKVGLFKCDSEEVGVNYDSGVNNVIVLVGWKDR